jgi:putative addiction module killer protein
MTSDIDKYTNVLYKGQNFLLVQTSEFEKFFASLRDRKARAKINDRLLRAADGNFGDVKSAGGISEIRVDYGPGYRVYFWQRGNEVVILLCGGDKRTQNRDIAFAKRLKGEIDRGSGTSSL